MSSQEIINKKFNRLTVLNLEYKKQKFSNNQKDGFAYFYRCRCDCGNICIVEKYKILRRHTRSCGCLHKETISQINKKHGMEKTRLYHIWQGIKRRCLNENETGYKEYGAKGINICEEWKNNSTTFIEWALKNGYNDKLTIDRIDNSKGYNPQNCRWVTPKQQARNTRNNHLITYNNETHCISEWAEILNINPKILYNRFAKKWDVKKAFEQPIRKRGINGIS